MKKRYRFLLLFMFLGSVIAPISSLEAGRHRDKPSRVGKKADQQGTSSNGTGAQQQSQAQRRRQQQAEMQQRIQAAHQMGWKSIWERPTLRGKPTIGSQYSRYKRANTPQQSQTQNTPPPLPQQINQAATQAHHVPPEAVAVSSEDTTKAQTIENNSSNQAEQPTIPQSQEQQTLPTSEATSSNTTTAWDDLFGDPVIDFDHVDPDELEQPNKMISTPVASTESPQLSDPNNASPDGVTVNNNQKQVPSNPSSMSVKQGIALLQGLNIALNGSNRPSPENREMAADMTHTVLADLDAIYHYEGEGSLGTMSKFASKFGQRLFAWLQEHPFANFRKESDKEAMRDFAQKLLTRFQDDADFRRDCEALEANFIQEREDYPSNCARACLQIVSLFLHPETV